MATQVKTGLIANDAITDAKIANVALTGVTASGGDSSTSLATTAFVAGEINSLIDAAPGALNTLNELAAALGDDAAFSTTVTNSIATKLPLAGGTMTGAITLGDLIASGSGGLSLQTDEGTKRLFIKDNGDVKVGNLAVGSATTAPLHVAKASADVQAVFGDNNSSIDDPSIRIIGRDSGNSAIRYMFAGLDADANHGFIGYNAGSGSFVNALTYNTSGNVGFAGQTSPGTPIHVGTSTSTGPRIQITHEDQGGFGALDIDSYGSATFRMLSNFSGSAMNGVADDAFGLGTPHNYPIIFTTSATERMRIAGNGYVTINHNTNTQGLKIIGGTSAANNSIVLENTATGGLAWDISSTGGGHGYGNGDLNFGQGFGVPRVQMKADGLVNFGNQTDYISLNGSSGIIQRVKTGSGNADIRFQLDAADYMQLKDTAAPGILSLGYLSATSNNSMVAIHGLGNDVALVVSNNELSNSASYGWAGRGGRYLHSNGTGWAGDGSDPAIVVGSSNAGNNRSGIGIVLHNESPNNDQYSPIIAFGNKSNSGSYNTAYATIVGKKTGQGGDANWSTGEIHMDTAGLRIGSNSRTAYMDNEPAFKMDEAGDITMPYRSYAYGQWSGSSFSVTNGTGFTMNVLRSQNMTYQSTGGHGYGMTVIKPGLYQMIATGLYDPGGTYIYVGWCINGSQLHHWHSNHTISNNHDYVSVVMRQLNAGDHITFENSSQVMTTAWGGGHSSWYISKFG